MLSFRQEIAGDGPAILQRACQLGVEGIITKRRGSVYRSGRVASGRKIKFAHFMKAGVEDSLECNVKRPAVQLLCYLRQRVAWAVASSTIAASF
jgi:ATP-dependent DNA ligase